MNNFLIFPECIVKKLNLGKPGTPFLKKIIFSKKKMFKNFNEIKKLIRGVPGLPKLIGPNQPQCH